MLMKWDHPHNRELDAKQNLDRRRSFCYLGTSGHIWFPLLVQTYLPAVFLLGIKLRVMPKEQVFNPDIY